MHKDTLIKSLKWFIFAGFDNDYDTGIYVYDEQLSVYDY